jgi:methylmalonyl-CoA epimerase
MIKKIDHIGIAVESIKEASKFYHDILGLNLDRTEIEAEQKSTVVFLPVGGDLVELIEPFGEEGPVARFMSKRGEGIHHLCFEVDDIEIELERLKSAGVELVTEEAIVVSGGNKAAFIHPHATHGVLIELYQRASKETLSQRVADEP